MSSVLRIEVSGAPDADAEELAGLLESLRSRLLELDLVSVDSVAVGPPPSGTKAFGGLGAGALIVSVLDSAFFVALAGVLKSWVGQSRNRKIKIQVGNDSLEISRATAEEQARVVEQWLKEHGQQ